MKINKNMGVADRWFRGAMGVGLIYLGPLSDVLTSDPLSGALLAVVGVLTVGSAAIGYCPLYHIAGFCTYRSPETEANPPAEEKK